MAQQHKVHGYDDLIDCVNRLKKDNKPINVYFTGSKDDTGRSWCPDCVEAQPFIEKAVTNADPNTHFIVCDVGDRPFLSLLYVLHGLVLHTVHSAEVTVKCWNLLNDHCLIDQKLELNGEDHLKFITDNPSSIKTLNIVEGSRLNIIPYGIFDAFSDLHRLLLETSGINILQSDRFEGAKTLTYLSLRNNEIRIIPSKVFSQLANLEEIELNKNRIEIIEDNAFDGMKNLQEVTLDNNRLQYVRRFAFTGASNIRILHLSYNEIETIEEGAFSLPRLRILFLSENKLKILPHELFIGAPNLEMAFIDRNEIHHIGKAFNNCNKLAVLNLNNNPLRGVNLSDFATIDNLDVLFLDDVKLQFPSELPSQSPSNSKLTTIMLNSNGLTDPGFLKHLSIFGRLEEIFAMNNTFTHFHDIDKVKSYFPNLKTLNLSRNEPSLCKWITDNMERIAGISVSSNTDDGDSCKN